MKITTTRKRNFFTFTLFIIISLFALISCEVDPVVSETSLPHKDRINNTFVFNQISFSNLSGDQDFKNAFDKFSSVRNKQTTALKHSNFTIDTTSIKKINYGNNITYTMFIRRSEFNESYFENLILKLDSLKNIEAYIVKYTLNSPLEYYSEHESFSIDADPEIKRIPLENTDDLIMARSTCISLYSTRCNGTLNSGCGGAWHTPGPNCQCVVIYESGLDCSTEGDDPNPGGGGDSNGGGGGGNNDGIVTAPNVDAYLWELKNFTSGELSREQRSYYNSNGNIKNNINTYLISKNFSIFSILDSKLAINVGMALSLDYKTFNWAFKNSNTILERASLYLTKNENSSQAIAFALEGLIVTKDGGDVDFEDQIINNLKGKAECVYGKLVDQNGNINWILENFEDEGGKPSEFNLLLQMSTALSSNTNASTATPKQSKIPNTFVISINANTLYKRTTLGLARTIIHEGIHVRLWEFVYKSEGKVAKEDFPGIYEYMRIYERNWDHQQMAAFYRETITKGLKQFDNAQHPDAFYDALAWEGLSEIKDKNGNNSIIYTEAWKKLSLTEQQNILQIITNEKNNGSKSCN